MGPRFGHLETKEVIHSGSEKWFSGSQGQWNSGTHKQTKIYMKKGKKINGTQKQLDTRKVSHRDSETFV